MFFCFCAFQEVLKGIKYLEIELYLSRNLINYMYNKRYARRYDPRTLKTTVYNVTCLIKFW